MGLGWGWGTLRELAGLQVELVGEELQVGAGEAAI